MHKSKGLCAIVGPVDIISGVVACDSRFCRMLLSVILINGIRAF